jgi:oligopeptide transport system permease protein
MQRSPQRASAESEDSVELINTPEDLIAGGAAPISAEELQYLKQQAISPLKAAVRRFLRDRRAVLCLSIILFIVLFSFLFPLFYVHMGPPIHGDVSGGKVLLPEQYHTASYQDLNTSDVLGTLFPLGAKSVVHPLGTDTNGRDILARLMVGVQTSIIVALAVEIFDIGVGVTLGALAGFFGGWLDMVLARFTDIMFAFPGLLLIVLVGATLGPAFDARFGAGLGRIMLIIGAIGFLVWPLMMRLVRGETLALRERQFIEAARTVGTSRLGIIIRHIVPNLMGIVIVAATLNVLGTIGTEAAISLLGVGIQPPNTSLGLMIADARDLVYISIGELLIPGTMLVVLVVCLAFIGDGVRDAFDPRTKD